GLSAMPAADPAVRAAIEARAAREGWEALHACLAEVDPEAAARIHPNDPQRLQRALEVYELTGRPLSDFHRQAGAALPYRPLRLALVPGSRELLRERIARRFLSMLEHGFVDEVEALYRRGDLHPGLPSMRSVGYRQVWSWLAGEIDRETMIAQAITATRQLAKRQLTWLRSYPDVIWLEPDGIDLPALSSRIDGHL
ncbi:MAG: tRNA (adenosine(37)-N6)-dimethylallyltransferase MiaA, partial [Ectothiorhodospiraceae bacterium]|nr:tRNA (adenosine(37)-N6)-dimethylallyltransferase MiaA [Ectothiorhodospiraceae bacterium]